MSVGTKSILFGVHSVFVHPILVFIAWWKLYGFPYDPRLWIAFIVHDLGYIGKPNMDGLEGEKHVELGGKIMAALFGKKWGEFTMFHSRFYCKQFGARPSKLCYADKLAICLDPSRFYLFRAKLSGEIAEYMVHALRGKYKDNYLEMEQQGSNESMDQRVWLRNLKTYMRSFVEDNKKTAP